MLKGCSDIFTAISTRSQAPERIPHQVNPLAIKVMAEIGIDISGQYSKSLDVFKEVDVDLVVSVCRSGAKTNCALCASPIVMGRPELISVRLPRAKHYLYYPFNDPSDIDGTEEEKIAAFRRTREEIKKWIIEKFADLKIDHETDFH